MCQVHTDAYVSLLARGKTDYNRLPPRKDYHVYITRGTYEYHHAYARQTHVNWKKKQRNEKKIKEKKEKKRKRKRKGKERKNKKNKKKTRGSKEWKREKNVILAEPRN